MNIPIYLIIHHTGGTDANPLSDSSNFSFAQCDALHKQKFNMKSSLGFYCGYHYYIEKNGKLFTARADSDDGAHTIGRNNSSLGICLAGNFDVTMPTAEQMTTLTQLLKEKVARYRIPANFIIPHRQFATKTCYGSKLSDDWARNLVTHETGQNDKITQAVKLLKEALNLLQTW